MFWLRFWRNATSFLVPLSLYEVPGACSILGIAVQTATNRAYHLQKHQYVTVTLPPYSNDHVHRPVRMPCSPGVWGLNPAGSSTPLHTLLGLLLLLLKLSFMPQIGQNKVKCQLSNDKMAFLLAGNWGMGWRGGASELFSFHITLSWNTILHSWHYKWLYDSTCSPSTVSMCLGGKCESLGCFFSHVKLNLNAGYQRKHWMYVFITTACPFNQVS